MKNLNSSYLYRIILCCTLLLTLRAGARAQDIEFTVKKFRPTKYTLVYQAGNPRIKAVRIAGDHVEIDSAYNDKDMEFTADSMVDIKSNRLFTEIAAMSKVELYTLEKKLQGIRCDSMYPYTISIVSASDNYIIELPAYGKYCYGSKGIQLLDDLYDYFSAVRR